uniref:LeoA/HP0731 family dynamin-like GTPase n=1 Tax=Pseudomonas aeruginosa TaxID=287 RepID=UPI000A4B7CA6
HCPDARGVGVRVSVESAVLAARDGITTIAKTVGMDIGKYLKFKPWGAVKFAKGANGALAALGVALEAWDSWEQYKREEAFKKAIAEMVDNFEQQRQDFLNLVNSERFKEEFFPDYLLLNSRRQELQSSLDEGRGRQQRFQAWRAEAESIDAEFKTLD